MKKLFKFCFLLFCLFYIFFFIKNNIVWKNIFEDTISLWLFKVVVGIVPMYILSSIILSIGLINNFFFKLINRFKLFENKMAFNLFVVSFLCGTPTTSVIVKNAYLNKQISYKQASSIINSCSFVSFLFVSIMLNNKLFFIISISQIITSIIIYIINNHSINPFDSVIYGNNIFSIINTIIEDLPLILLRILVTMLIVSIIITPFFEYSNLFNFFEVTIGLNNILKNQYNEFINIIYISSLLSFNGIAILLQVYNIIKNTRLSFKHFIISRIIHTIISVFISLVLLLIINFLF